MPHFATRWLSSPIVEPRPPHGTPGLLLRENSHSAFATSGASASGSLKQGSCHSSCGSFCAPEPSARDHGFVVFALLSPNGNTRVQRHQARMNDIHCGVLHQQEVSHAGFALPVRFAVVLRRAGPLPDSREKHRVSARPPSCMSSRDVTDFPAVFTFAPTAVFSEAWVLFAAPAFHASLIDIDFLRNDGARISKLVYGASW